MGQKRANVPAGLQRERATETPITETLDKVKNDEIVETILDAGLAELTEFGLRRSSIDSVAERAGIGRMTIYRRFNGKKALAQAVLSREAQRFLDDVNREVGRVSTAAAGLEEGFVTAAKLALGDTLGQRLLSLDPQHALPFITRAAAQWLDASAAAARAALANTPDAAEYDDETLDAAATAMVRLAHSYTLSPPVKRLTEKELRVIARRMLRPILEAGRS